MVSVKTAGELMLLGGLVVQAIQLCAVLRGPVDQAVAAASSTRVRTP